MELLQGWLPTYIINKIAALPPPSNIEDADVHVCIKNMTGKIVIADMYNDLCHYYKIPPLIALILALNSASQALRKPPL
jgi:hypothetical protein